MLNHDRPLQTSLLAQCEAFMLVNSKETSHAVATDVVDWALQQKIIDVNQRRVGALDRCCATAIFIPLECPLNAK